MNSTGASVNQTYVAVAGTTQTGTTIVGNPISGAGGTPQGFASSPGTISTGSSPQLVSDILPGMHVLGAYGGAVVSPYGTFGGTGTGGTGTYGLTVNQTTFTFTGSISGTTL